MLGNYFHIHEEYIECIQYILRGCGNNFQAFTRLYTCLHNTMKVEDNTKNNRNHTQRISEQSVLQCRLISRKVSREEVLWFVDKSITSRHLPYRSWSENNM